MKGILALTVALSLCGQVAFAEVHSVKLTEGTIVPLSLSESISSKTAAEGNRVSFEVVDDVLSEDGKQVLIKAGTVANGSITKLEKNGAFGKAGELAITIDKTRTVDGKRVPLKLSINKAGESKRGTSIGLAAIGAFVILWPLMFFLFKKGKDATLPAGTQLNAVVDRDVMVDFPVPESAPGSESTSDKVPAILHP